jgi:Tfp pilus assembly protein PilF
MQLGNMPAAYRAIVEREGFHTAGSYSNLAIVLMKQGKSADAIPYLERAVELPPVDGEYEFS